MKASETTRKPFKERFKAAALRYNGLLPLNSLIGNTLLTFLYVGTLIPYYLKNWRWVSSSWRTINFFYIPVQIFLYLASYMMCQNYYWKHKMVDSLMTCGLIECKSRVVVGINIILSLVFSSFFVGYHMFNMIVGEGRMYVALLFIISIQSWFFCFFTSIGYLVAIFNNHFEKGYWGEKLTRLEAYQTDDSKYKSDIT